MGHSEVSLSTSKHLCWCHQVLTIIMMKLGGKIRILIVFCSVWKKNCSRIYYLTVNLVIAKAWVSAAATATTASSIGTRPKQFAGTTSQERPISESRSSSKSLESRFPSARWQTQIELCPRLAYYLSLEPLKQNTRYKPYGPLARYVKLRVAHVPCMPESLTSGFLWIRWRGKTVPGIPGACATRNFTYLERGPCQSHYAWLLIPSSPLLKSIW